MSQIKRFKNYEIVAESWETYRNWGHKATLYRNDYKVNAEKITYYNRTWESYQYQSVMRNVVYKEMQYLATRAVELYKEANHIIRLAAAKKQAVLDDFKANNEDYKTLKEFYNNL